MDTPSLTALGPDTLLEIYSYLDVDDAFHLGLTSKRMYSLFKREKLWKYYLKRDVCFGRNKPNIETDSYRELYQTATLQIEYYHCEGCDRCENAFCRALPHLTGQLELYGFELDIEDHEGEENSDRVTKYRRKTESDVYPSREDRDYEEEYCCCQIGMTCCCPWQDNSCLARKLETVCTTEELDAVLTGEK